MPEVVPFSLELDHNLRGLNPGRAGPQGARKSATGCYRIIPEILKAVGPSIRTISGTGTATGILRFPTSWKQVAHNAGDYSIIINISS
ncbi:hypothetical protein AVEN_221753-1 [Araneus ventricosus]|uniref:Uncharacterized protein n=1 Tax=Araneus ventricosus TaxID=182803 RepID=A0A4Y2FMF5_ARAVE|nr:hypothetical protein AVEN_221753-1 [Araneus ventricosus]